jgi:aminoglycoside/choline kinase family phosphotransferase
VPPAPNRHVAAYALGVVITDVSLACSARDSQHLQNLFSELTALEKALGTAPKIQVSHQRINSDAEQNDWEAARREVERLHSRHDELLVEMGDQNLATFVRVGRWLRTMQIATNVVVDRQLLDHDELAIGDLEHLTALSKALEPLAEVECATDKCLKEMHRRLTRLQKLWSQPAADKTGRLKMTAELLSECLAPLQTGERNSG